jgi:hypothetical protein
MPLLLALWAGWARAEETSPPPGETTPAADPTLAELEARIRALETQLTEQQQAQFLRDAEALAAPEGPAPPQQAARASFNAMNPGLTAFGDVVGQLGVHPDAGIDPGSTLYLRSAELEFRADVDPFAKADAVISFEQEAPPLDGTPGAGFGAGPEEAYIDLVALPARLSARVGKFKVPFGVINRTHAHDLPWIDAPDLMGGEGYNDTGGTLQWLLPVGPAGLTLTAGAFGGEPFDPENTRANLGALGRAELFVGTGTVGLSLGGSALKDVGGDARYLGGDVTFRWKPSQQHSVVVMSELVDGDVLAGYAAVQVQPARMWYLGLRQDFGAGDPKSNLYISTYSSEFLRVRLGGGYVPATGAVDVLSQLTFVWGSHPVEPWWVNR